MNRLDAKYCRICGEKLVVDTASNWVMHRGNATRQASWPIDGAGLLNSPKIFHDLKEYGFTDRSTQLSQPLGTGDCILLPNPNHKGFSLYSPEVKKTLWTCQLGIVPPAHSTPVIMGNTFYFLIEYNKQILLASCQLDDGRLDFLELIPKDFSNLQTPLVVQNERGAAVVWALRDCLAVVKFDPDNRLEQDREGFVAIIHSDRMAQGEFYLNPAAQSDWIYSVTNRGKIIQFDWTSRLTELRYQGVRRIQGLENGWNCGPPIIQNRDLHYNVLFMCSRPSSTGRNLSFLAVVNELGNLKTIPMMNERDGRHEEIENVELLLRRSVLLLTNMDTQFVFVSSTLNNAIYYVDLDKDKTHWKHVPCSCNFDQSMCFVDSILLYTRDDMVVLGNLFGVKDTICDRIQLLSSTGEHQHPIMDPIVVSKSIFVVVSGGLYQIKTADNMNKGLK